MCLIFFSVQNHPNYKLTIAANRDEFYDRKTAPADYWNDYPQILGGRDLEAQGTWMAMTKTGKISFVTNYRDPKNINPKAPSRGQLVSNYLERNVSPEAYLKEVEEKSKTYNGFNLVVGSSDSLWYFSNYGSGIQKISPGLSGLSNHLLETPWPKIVHGKEMLRPILQKRIIHPDEILDVLRDPSRAPDDHLPHTGVGLERERALSSMFIKTDGYGSRCSTAVLVDYDNNVIFSERTYNLNTFDYTTKSFQFKID